MWVYIYDGMELNITKNEAKQGYHSGQCDYDIQQLKNVPRIKRQLNKLDPVKLISALSEYGAWDETELSDHETNKERILWLACAEIIDNIN